jgi:hypothetical protein
MGRRARTVRWLVFAVGLAVSVAVANVLLLGTAQEDDRVGRLRPILVGETPATTSPVTPGGGESPSIATTHEEGTDDQGSDDAGHPGGDLDDD